MHKISGYDHNKPHSLMSDPISTMYFHNMFCDLLNKILFKPNICNMYTYAVRSLRTGSFLFRVLACVRCDA